MRENFSGGGRGGPRRGGFRGGFQQRTPPVQEGEEMDVKIEAIAEKGDGVAKKNGFVIFVPGTKVGDNVKVRIKKVLRNMSFAEVIGQGHTSEDIPQDEASETESWEDSNSASEEDSGEDSEDF